MTRSFRVVIPARFGATRLPGKPLLDVCGRPLIAHVLDVGARAGASDVLVATDDDRVIGAVRSAGGRALMTSSEHASGTDRIAEVARAEGWEDGEIVVNLQGDEPMVPPALLSSLAAALQAHPRAAIATVATPMRESADLFSPQIVKVVIDREGYALYFSRAPIPWVRDSFAAGAVRDGSLPSDVPFLRHLGLYAYRVETLRRLADAPRGAYERAESLEQLRALEMGMAIHVTRIEEAPPPGVDTEEDLERVRRALAAP